MIYLFDKQQNIVGLLKESDLTAGKINFKINTAIDFSFSLPINKGLSNDVKYVSTPHPKDKSKHLIFRLMSRADNVDSIEYTASEFAYQELASSAYIEDKRPNGVTAQQAMTIALDGSQWSLGTVNISGNVTTNFYYITNLEAIQKVVSLMGGEVYFYITITGNKISGRFMDYVFRQGNDTSKVFADGSNLLTVTKKQQSDSIYTAILPRGKGEQVSSGSDGSPDGYGRRIDISGVTWSKSGGNPLDKPNGSKILEDPDATAKYGHINGSARLYLKTFDEIEDPNVLIQQAYQTLMSINHPLVEYSATVAKVGDLSLGDTVLIMHSNRDLSYKTRVFEVKYDLLNPEMTELSLGDNLSSNSITSQINQLSNSISTTSNQAQWSVSNGGHNNTTFGATEPPNPQKGDVWFKALPNGNTEEYYFDGSIWVLGAKTDQQWQENIAVAQGANTVFYGTVTPVGAVVGDVWFKNDNNEPDGKVMYTYSGSVWIKFSGGADASRLQIGTIDAAKINVMNISADNIVTGKLSANFIKGGQLDFSQINGININASNIVSGSISGSNLNINLNTGQVVFQNGRIYSSDYTTDINIDQGYISTANGNTRTILKNGQLQLISPNYYDLQTNPYLSIYNYPRAFDGTGQFNSAIFSARDRVIVGTKDGLDDMFWFGDRFYFGQSNFYGMSSGSATGAVTGKEIPTTVGGGKTGVAVVGGRTYTNTIGGSDSPSIIVGWSPDNVYSGNRVRIDADFFHAGAVYSKTSSNGANVFVSPDGALLRSSSSSKYKLDIEYEQQADTANKLLTIDPATWHDKFESEQLDKFHEIGVDPERTIDMSNRRYYGIIAEDLVKAGLEHLVSRNVETGEVDGVEYSKIGLALIPIIRDLRNRLNEQYVEIERLKEKLK